MSIDLRPSALDVDGYPGNAHTLTITGPAGALDGTTWAATILGEPIDSVTVDGDDLVLGFTFPLAIGSHEIILSQTDVTPHAVKATGRVRSTLTATRDQDSTHLTMTQSTATGTLVIVGTGPSGSEGVDGVSDGDKGDIIVSEGGTVWSIEAGAVTPAKLSFDPATQAELEAEAAIRAAADTALSDSLSTEQTVRAAADTALDGRLDTIEADYTTAAEVTTAVTAAIDALIAGAPGALDTLNELAAAIGDDADFAATITAALANKQPLDADLTALAAAGNSAVLAATTASFTTADETKLDGIEAGAEVNTVDSVNGATGAVVLDATDVGADPAGSAAAAEAAANAYTDAEVAALSGTYVALTGNQTVAGTKTFSSAPSVPDASFAIAKTTGLQTALDAKAPIASPTFTGTVSGVTKAHVGLGNVDNTSDANKPVSTATQTALDAKAPKTATVGTNLGTTGTVNLDMAALDGTYQSIAATGNITFTTSNRAAGRSVTIKIAAGGSDRTITLPSWILVGAAVALTSGKVGILTVTFFDTTDAAAVAAWAVQA